MKRSKVFLTADAERDVEDIAEYIAQRDSPAAAQRVLNQMEKVIDSLCAMPERGAHPRELLALGIRDYRQIIFKPWRLIYRLAGNSVFVYLVADGRRDIRALLVRRLLDG